MKMKIGFAANDARFSHRTLLLMSFWRSWADHWRCMPVTPIRMVSFLGGSPFPSTPIVAHHGHTTCRTEGEVVELVRLEQQQVDGGDKDEKPAGLQHLLLVRAPGALEVELLPPPTPGRSPLECFRRVNSGGECGAPRGEGGRNSRRQGCPGRRSSPGTWFPPRSLPPRAPLARFSPPGNTPTSLRWLGRLPQRNRGR